MTVKWIKKKKGATALNITQSVTSVSWSGSVSEAARTADISVASAPEDKNIKSLGLNIGAGDTIKLYEDGELIFLGEVQASIKSGETGTVTYSCYDLLNHLLRSTGVYNFKNTTAEKITEKVCASLGIKTGSIAPTKVPLKKMIFDGDTFYDIIMKAYTKAAKQTGKKYICRMHGTKLSVEIKGEKVKDFVLQEGYNIINASYEETIENMVNIVKIYNDKGKQTGVVKNDRHIEKYGIYQNVYKKEDGINAATAAKNMLNGIEKKINASGVNGDLDCIAGNAVKIYDKAVKLNGLFWVESDTHTWENGTHTMSLELSFKNVMDSKEYEETEEKKKDGDKKNKDTGKEDKDSKGGK
ncbi:MAG: hypothetical protein HFH68_08740 [Lachnospiraceae bacterium]|nr:hypothetical protein [Lachnospiraceae bacterium]